ncbi:MULTISPECIES: response regulator transcription factor [Paenibacillus]|uniref:Response regulator transcription factor n=1 Tax=Paenibacillus radicis (ex Xue et al. 2023) TaxID=2972489 RepID=A0ABT1YMY5_9BACL|nr:response regulator transcription factor [Paenibacillus radicis (ex Xue et al. 2023)]MCR8633764.1 response regulator transcription factor [Paenibacillus radicis (ex Xue et al. 2023)]
MQKVLIIEDDTIIGEMLKLYLSEENFNVQRVETGQESFDALETFVPDVILLDLILPDMDGADLCKLLRHQTHVPILVISMKTKVTDRIQALSSGADDYLCKPFSMQELKARIIAQLRRSSPQTAFAPAFIAAASSSPTATISSNAQWLQLDLERRALIVNDEVVEITFSEFEIMKLFYSFPGKVFSRDELINAIRGIDSYVNERSIDVHITNLRKKIEYNPRQPQHIKTVWGVGYKFELLP